MRWIASLLPLALSALASTASAADRFELGVGQNDREIRAFVAVDVGPYHGGRGAGEFEAVVSEFERFASSRFDAGVDLGKLDERGDSALPPEPDESPHFVGRRPEPGPAREVRGLNGIPT